MYARSLPGRILQIVEAPRWGGGLTWDELAHMVGRHTSDKEFRSAVYTLRSLGRVSTIRGYVVSNPKGRN